MSTSKLWFLSWATVCQGFISVITRILPVGMVIMYRILKPWKTQFLKRHYNIMVVHENINSVMMLLFRTLWQTFSLNAAVDVVAFLSGGGETRKKNYTVVTDQEKPISPKGGPHPPFFFFFSTISSFPSPHRVCWSQHVDHHGLRRVDRCVGGGSGYFVSMLGIDDVTFRR